MEENKREHRNMGDMGKVVEVDAEGQALTPETVRRIETLLEPLCLMKFTHVDLLIKRVSIQHLVKGAPGTFRKKLDPSLVVEALEFHGNFDAVEKFVGGDAEFRDGRLLVATTEGPLYASPMDWIVREGGKFEVVPPQAFAADYEEIG